MFRILGPPFSQGLWSLEVGSLCTTFSVDPAFGSESAIRACSCSDLASWEARDPGYQPAFLAFAVKA